MPRVLILAAALALARPGAAADLGTLKSGDTLHGFRVKTVYLDAADRPIGARFVHVATGFTFDLMRIESAPQGFIWVNSFPTCDKGEPHTQEHLLLGKGDRGRKFGSYAGDVARRSRARSPSSGAPRITSTPSPGATRSGRCSPSSIDALLASRLHRRGDPPRGAQLRRRQGRRRHAAARGEGHRLQRDGAPRGHRDGAGCGARAAMVYGKHAPAVLRLGRLPRRHPHDDAAGHPQVPRATLPPREHGHDRGVPGRRRSTRCSRASTRSS